MKRLMILALIFLFLGIAIYFGASWNRPVWIDQIVPSGFVYETGAVADMEKDLHGIGSLLRSRPGPATSLRCRELRFMSENAPEAHPGRRG